MEAVSSGEEHCKALEDAMEKCSQGDVKEYNSIMKHLLTSPMAPEEMEQWLQALCACVPKLSGHHNQLVTSALKLQWFNREDGVVSAYIEFLTTLLSTHVDLLSTVFSNLTQQLWVVPPQDGADGDDGGRRVMENVHRAIRAVLALVPSASSVLMQLVKKGYPFMGRNAEIQEVALRNVLYMTMYCPLLRDEILELVVHQMLSIDVQLPSPEAREEWDYFGSEEESDMEEEEDGESEGEALDVTWGLESAERGSIQCTPPSSGCAPPPLAFSVGLEHARKQVMKNPLAEKTDVMVATSLQYLYYVCHESSPGIHHPIVRVKLEEAKLLLQTMLGIFERVVLPTHASSGVQFLLFHLTSVHETLPKIFLDFLWNRFKDPRVTPVTKRRLAAYMGSYVARLECVPLKTIMKCVTSMSRWIHKYIDSTSPENLRPDAKKHGPFYSLCQTLFYIFSFRHLALLQMRGGAEYLRKLKFERLITSQLNPLKVCLPWVVERFASLACQHEVVFSYTVLEQNKRLMLSSDSVFREKNSLDCYFPFDPLQLIRSWELIKRSYRVWKEPLLSESTDDDEEEDIAMD